VGAAATPHGPPVELAQYSRTSLRLLDGSVIVTSDL
jgi:hypothetical protein